MVIAKYMRSWRRTRQREFTVQSARRRPTLLSPKGTTFGNARRPSVYEVAAIAHWSDPPSKSAVLGSIAAELRDGA
jgi:hypothetical protein